jgi:hypothetical protein
MRSGKGAACCLTASTLPGLHRENKLDWPAISIKSMKHLYGIRKRRRKIRWNLGLSRSGNSMYTLYLSQQSDTNNKEEMCLAGLESCDTGGTNSKAFSYQFDIVG